MEICLSPFRAGGVCKCAGGTRGPFLRLPHPHTGQFRPLWKGPPLLPSTAKVGKMEPRPPPPAAASLHWKARAPLRQEVAALEQGQMGGGAHPMGRGLAPSCCKSPHSKVPLGGALWGQSLLAPLSPGQAAPAGHSLLAGSASITGIRAWGPLAAPPARTPLARTAADPSVWLAGGRGRAVGLLSEADRGITFHGRSGS